MKTKYIFQLILFIALFIFASTIAFINIKIGVANNDIFSYLTGILLTFYSVIASFTCIRIIDKRNKKG